MDGSFGITNFVYHRFAVISDGRCRCVKARPYIQALPQGLKYKTPSVPCRPSGSQEHNQRAPLRAIYRQGTCLLKIICQSSQMQENRLLVRRELPWSFSPGRISVSVVTLWSLDLHATLVHVAIRASSLGCLPVSQRRCRCRSLVENRKTQ
jgi:hypothetical protein